MNRIVLILACMMCAIGAMAQTGDNGNTNSRKIEIVNSSTLEVDEYHGPNVKVLRGDVEFYHDSASMFCDSAFYNSRENTFRAFGRVHMYRLMPEDDTVHLWGDSLDYDGNNRLARVRENVVMVKDSMRMLTNNIDYDLDRNVVNYFDGGTTYSGEDTLISELGFFYPKKNDLVYNRDVVIKNPNYKVYSDTLTHNIKSKISTFKGPTEIVGDDNYLYSERGWYNHQADEGTLTQNSYLVSKQHKLQGDTIMYFRKQKYGIGKSRVEIQDTVENVRLFGNEARYYEEPERSLITDSAIMRYVDKSDTLYMHADSIASVADTMYTASDTSIYRIIKAYPHVKMYRVDIQAMSDSLVYNTYDSVIEMYKNPVIWHNDDQITATQIRLYTMDDGIDMVEMINEAFVAEKVDNVPRYNQICGKNMVAYLDSNKIQQVEVMGDSKTIYYTTEQDTLVTGMNTIESSNMSIYFKNGKIKTLWFYKSPKGAIYPLEGLTRRQSYLNGFVWYDKHRPMRMEDIFVWGEISEERISEALFMAEEEAKRKEEEEKMELE